MALHGVGLAAMVWRELSSVSGRYWSLCEQAIEIEERRIQSCVHFMTLKKLNRLAHIRLKKGRDQTHEVELKGLITWALTLLSAPSLILLMVSPTPNCPAHLLLSSGQAESWCLPPTAPEPALRSDAPAEGDHQVSGVQVSLGGQGFDLLV